MTDYDPITKRFSFIRHARYILLDDYNAEQFMAQFTVYKNAQIVHLVYHDPVFGDDINKKFSDDARNIAERQKVVINGVPFIDAFGFYVYVSAAIVLKNGKDCDYREVPEPETFDIKGNLILPV